MPSFLSRKKAAPVSTTIPPGRTVPANHGLDITTISLPTSNPSHQLNGKTAYQSTYKPDYKTDYTYANHGGLPSPPITPDPQSAKASMASYQQQPQQMYYEQPSSKYVKQHQQTPSHGHVTRLPSIEKLAMSSPVAYSTPPSSSHTSARHTSANGYHSRDDEPDGRSSSLSSTDSNLLYDTDVQHERSSSATSASSFSNKSNYLSRNHDVVDSAHSSYQEPSPEPVRQNMPSSSQHTQQQQQQPTCRGIPAPTAYPHAVQQSKAFNSQAMMSVPSNSTATMTASPSLSCTSSMRKTSSRYALGDFDFIRTLGTGSFGRVHLVRSKHNARYYAVKVLSKERVVKMKQVEHTNSEREMLERVRHPFLINLWGTFKDAANLYMVMDFVSGGELFSLLRKSQRFPDPVAKFFAAEVALALDYLHSLDIIYRDLKPENILLAADGHVKITDFGFAKYVPDITWTLCGTPDYLAPEIVQSRGYNKSVDWYALGVLIFEMLAGYPPFFTEDPNPMRLYEKIISGKIRYPSHLTAEAKDLLKNLLINDLTKRYGNLANGSRDIFAHTWFSEVDWERLYKKEIPAPYVPRIEGEGDASCFEQYAEIDISDYGLGGADPHGHLFAAF